MIFIYTSYKNYDIVDEEHFGRNMEKESLDNFNSTGPSGLENTVKRINHYLRLNNEDPYKGFMGLRLPGFLIKVALPFSLFAGFFLKEMAKPSKPDFIEYVIIRNHNGQPESIEINGITVEHAISDKHGRVIEIWGGNSPLKYDSITSIPMNKHAAQEFKQIIDESQKLSDKGYKKEMIFEHSFIGQQKNKIEADISPRHDFLSSELLKFAKSQTPDSIVNISSMKAAWVKVKQL